MTAEDLCRMMDKYKLRAEDIAAICCVTEPTVYSWRINRRRISRPAIALLRRWEAEYNES